MKCLNLFMCSRSGQGRLRSVALLLCLVVAASRAAGAELSEPEQIARVRLPDYKTIKLDDGLTLLLMERHALPLVSFHWLMKSGGALCDAPGQEGLASLTAKLLRKGTQSRSADQISETLDFVGAEFDAGASLEYASGSAEFVTKDLELAVDLVSDTLLHPSFPPEEADKMIKQDIDGIKEAKAIPQQVIGRYYEGFLCQPHLYGRPVSGTETSLSKIRRQDIAGFHATHYVPNELILAVVGDFSTSELEARLRDKFAAWKPGTVARPDLKEPPRFKGRRALIVDKPDATQTFFEFGNIGLARTNRDWVAVQVVNTLFGGRFTSMINSELRIKSGLTYGANSRFSARQLPGPFVISSFTPNESSGRALDLALEVLAALHEKGLTAEQLQSAKTYIEGQFGPSLQTNDQLAQTLCELEFYGLGRQYIDTLFDRVDAVTLADAGRVIAACFPLKDLAFVFLGRAAVIEPVARKLASDLQKKTITAPGF
jgi:predicted Zn-dependent peptidase